MTLASAKSALIIILPLAAIGLALAGAGAAVGWFFGGTPHITIVQAAESEKKEPTEYTCSMHPQVRMPNPDDKCPICAMDLIPVMETTDDGPGSERRLVMSHAALKLAEVETEPVTRFFPEKNVRLFGTMEYDETRISTISAYFPGRLERLYVDYTGVSVQAGDHLAEIYSPEIITTHTDLRQALAAIENETDPADRFRQPNRDKLAAIRDRLRLWGLDEEQIRELEEAEEPTERLTIFSPTAGIVVEKMATEGRYVKTGDAIYTVADLDHLWLQLEAYESQLPWIRFGQKVSFETDSLPGRAFDGRVSFVSPGVDMRTRTVRVRVNVDNHDRLLKPGMFVRATATAQIAGHGMLLADDLAGKWISPMHPEIVKDGPGVCDVCGMDLVPIESLGYVAAKVTTGPPLVVPATAPLITGRRAVVYVQVPETDRPTFEGREVMLGPRAGDFYIVEDGLEEGELVVTNGAFKIDSAMQILAKPSMMNPPDSTSQPDATSQPEPVRIVSVPDEVMVSLSSVYGAYLSEQQALAADGLDEFVIAARSLMSAVDLVTTDGLDDRSAAAWSDLRNHLAGTSDMLAGVEDLATARAVFEHHSLIILDLEERFGHAGSQTWYRHFCPMAFGDRGAVWLSRTEEINNPFLGVASGMPHCGDIQAEFAPREPSEDDDS